MNAKTAYKILVDVAPNRKVVSCYEYESVFVFDTQPANYKPANEYDAVFDGAYSVDKTTREVLVFQPFNMPLEEYERGKKVPLLDFL